MTGAGRERELVNLFDKHGWGALRLPSSGGGTQRDLPDVLAGRIEFSNASAEALWKEYGNRGHGVHSELWAVELKSGKQTTLYVTQEEVEALDRFAQKWGAKPFLGGRSTKQISPTGHFLIRPEDARKTPDGNYGLPVAEFYDRAYAVIDSDGVAVL